MRGSTTRRQRLRRRNRWASSSRGSKGKRTIEAAALARVEPLRRAINPANCRTVAVPIMGTVGRDLATHTDPRTEAALMAVVAKHPRSRNELIELRTRLMQWRGMLVFVFCIVDSEVVTLTLPP